MLSLSIDDLRGMGVRVQVDKTLPYINKYMEAFGITTPNRLIGFLSNILQESGYFRYVEEIASGDDYDTRVDLGNTPEKDGDGRVYKGKGYGMITGKSNYRLFTKFVSTLGIDIDFVKNPQRVKEPEYAVLSAIWFWDFKGIAEYADRGDFYACWSIWNTGRPDSKKINGVKERRIAADNIIKWLTLITNKVYAKN